MEKFARSLFVALALIYSFNASALHTVQSEFEGPVYIKSWQHWQPSWNVERDLSIPPVFKILRGWDGARTPAVVFEYVLAEPGDQAVMVCEGKRRKGQWDFERYQKEFPLVSVNLHAHKYFLFEGDGCVDEKGKNVTEKISVKVIRKGGVAFEYSVTPMYVRSAETFGYNEVPAYMAHAGSGAIHVATEISDASPDFWDGVKVEPRVNFLDSTYVKKDGVVGLHRHRGSQEMYWADKGMLRVQNGVAGVAGNSYRNVRLWDPSSKEYREVDEVRAEGGWIETRVLEHGEKGIIVPNLANENVVYFHGVQALQDCAFWTAGARN